MSTKDRLAPNAYALYQVRDGEAFDYLRFSSLRQMDNKAPTDECYDLVYSGKLRNPDKDAEVILDELFERFNTSYPQGYTGRSMSVSDVVVLNQNGKQDCYYVEPIGFKKITGFLQEERNHLKSAEMVLEDDYDMIDGIINNGEKKSIHEALAEHTGKDAHEPRLNPHKEKASELER